MSDPIERTIRGLRGQQPPGGFAPASAIRRRGARRRHRQVVAAGLAVLAVSGGTAAWAATQAAGPGPDVAASPTPSLSAPSSVPTAVPSSIQPSIRPPAALSPAMFLTAADLGSGEWTIEQSSDIRPDHWPWQDICKSYRRGDYPSLAGRAQMDWRDLHRTDGGGAVAFQMIERYQPGAGPANLADVRARLHDCAGLQSTDPVAGNYPLRWTLVADRFAGDDAVLAKCEVFPDSGPARVYFAVSVRVGDLVSTVWLTYGPSEAVAREIAVRAAARLG